MLDARLAEFMQRVVSEGKESVIAGKSSLQLHGEFALGRRIGKTIVFSSHDREEMVAMLLANGYGSHPVDTSGMSRSDKLAAGVPNEKTGGGSVKVGRVSIKALAGQPLNVGGKAMLLPNGSHLDANWAAIAEGIDHSSIMVVENYEVFDQIHRVRFALPSPYATPLVIYRGDRHESRQDNVLAFLNAIMLPVLACGDVDPQGLLIASRLPRFAGFVAPDSPTLEKLLASPRTARSDLYQQQVYGAQDSLDCLSPVSGLYSLWQLVKRSRAGVVHERWIDSPVPCQVWLGNLNQVPELLDVSRQQ